MPQTYNGYQLHQIRRPMGDLPAGYWIAALPTADSWLDHDYSGATPYAVARQISAALRPSNPWHLDLGDAIVRLEESINSALTQIAA